MPVNIKGMLWESSYKSLAGQYLIFGRGNKIIIFIVALKKMQLYEGKIRNLK